LSHADMRALFGTCRTCRDAVKVFMKSAMKVDKVLRRFFREDNKIGQFQYLQGETGMIVTGSVALQLFNREEYKNCDLDTYCILKRCGVVGEWYQSIGYAFEAAGRQKARFSEDYERTMAALGMDREDVMLRIGSDIHGGERYMSHNIAEVWNFRNTEGVKIQLVATDIIPEAVVLAFHSTCVMNILTQKAAYALFPNITFLRNETLLVNAKG
ncbi:hypothetical protein C8J55DRAFT_429658, partial [Lentinula edodes]